MLPIDSIFPDTLLPTLDRLQVTVDYKVDVQALANGWLCKFENCLKDPDDKTISQLFIADSYWRDILALTWDFRTFSGVEKIIRFIHKRVTAIRPRNFQLHEDSSLSLQQPYTDVVWISLTFRFETDIGTCYGIARLVPHSQVAWMAHAVFTNLEELKGFPERIGPLRDESPANPRWAEQRVKELSFETQDPAVLVIGAGHGGLGIAARLKALQVPTLVVDKVERIGDTWRNRYDTTTLHDYIWFDQMPYMSFPSTWPVYIPATKLAGWLEFYVDALDLNVWTSTTVVKAAQDEVSGIWAVHIQRRDGSMRLLQVKHVVFATGLGDANGEAPTYPGMGDFQGDIFHSSRYKKAEAYRGKAALIIGACNSAHDIARDLYEHGIGVTMHQRSSTHVMTTKKGWKTLAEALYSENSPPPDVSDRILYSFPAMMNVEMNRRNTQKVAELDKDLLDGLEKAGFKLNTGIHGSGFGLLYGARGGGFYLDVGAGQLVADGKIKLKSGSEIQSFGENVVRFEDGAEVKADVVVFATGWGDPMVPVRQICGEEVAAKCKPLWGLDEEGELNSVWRDWGVKNMWAMMGGLGMARFGSMRLALQIKAIEEGVFGERYSLSK